MADACLFMMAARKVFWINLHELLALGTEEEAVDWESPSPPPFFSADVPDVHFYQETYHHFVFDSEIYVGVGGLLGPFEINDFLDGSPYLPGRGLRGTCDTQECLSKLPSCKIYRFDVENKRFTGADPSVPRLPTPFAPSFLGNISGDGDVYCLVHCGSHLPETEGFWVLSSSSSGKCQWQPLSPPPPLDFEDFGGDRCRCFVFQGKLFLHLDLKEPSMYSFDPTTNAWTPVGKDTMDSLMPFFDTGIGQFCAPSLTIPRLSNCSVVLSWSFPRVMTPGDLPIDVKMDALLVNNQNGAVILRQSLDDDCLEGIRPTAFDAVTSRFSFVDLGNGIVCALLFGYTYERECPVLCISVFTLTVIEANIDIGAGTEASPKDQSFLSVCVHLKRVFAMEHNAYPWMLDPFVFTPKKELPQ